MYGSPSVEVRAYDMGGYGDVAASLRVFDFLARRGHNAVLSPQRDSVRAKISILDPRVATGEGSKKSDFSIDVCRLENRDNIFVDEFDTAQNRRIILPNHVKPSIGMYPHAHYGNDGALCPMFYRPYREEEQSEKKDPRAQMIRAYGNRLDAVSMKEVARVVGSLDAVGFAHWMACASEHHITGHKYLEGALLASRSFERRLGIGMFVSSHLEERILEEIKEDRPRKDRFNVVSSSGEISVNDPKNPYLLFLGPQDQMMTTSLFFSAEIPVMVTGDLSLSDAIYNVGMRGGVGFFYDAPPWKVPTLAALGRMAREYSPDFGREVRLFDSFISPHDQGARRECINGIARALGSPRGVERFSKNWHDAIAGAMQRRFPNNQFSANDNSLNPVFVQDSICALVEKKIGSMG